MKAIQFKLIHSLKNKIEQHRAPGMIFKSLLKMPTCEEHARHKCLQSLYASFTKP